MVNFETLSGAAFIKMESQEIAALSRDELLCLVFRSKAIVTAIATLSIETADPLSIAEETPLLLVLLVLLVLVLLLLLLLLLLLCHEFRSKAIVTATAMTLSTETVSDPLSVAEVLNMQPPEENEVVVDLSKQSTLSSTLSSTSGSISLLPSEPLPWRPNTRPRLPPGALLDIDQGPMYDILTEWLPFESLCHLDSALCQKWRGRRAEWLAMLSTKVLLFNREDIRVLTDPYRPDSFTHKALRAAALKWVRKRGIHLASLQLPYAKYGKNRVDMVELLRIRQAVASLALNGHLDKLETISVGCCDYIKDADFAAILSKCYSSVKSIDIQLCGLTESAAVHIKRCTKLESFYPIGNESSSEIMEIFQTCRKLRKLDLRAFENTDDILKSVATNCHILEYLDLEGCQVSDDAISAVAKSCPLLQCVNLTYADITDASVVVLCNHCSILKRMFLRDCRNLTDAAVLAVADKLPGLTHIDLSGIAAITSSAVETLASKCCELEFIGLTRCTNVSDAALVKIAEHCSKLRELRVAYLNLTDAAVLAVAQRLPGLTHINLYHNTTITSSAVETLASKCRALEDINLSYCSKVSDATLSMIAEHCSNLKVLSVEGCPNNVTVDGLSKIATKCTKLKTVITSSSSADIRQEIPQLCHMFPHVNW